MRVAVILVLTALLAASCGGDDEPRAEEPTAPTETATLPAPVFARGEATIRTADGPVRLNVEIAETDAQLQYGLMFRQSLPPNEGMIFLFPGETQGGFWMKNTLIPLSIAFYDQRGRIRRILDMEPCRADPCEVYDPGVRYHGALEVNKGAFARLGVRKGDRIEVDVSGGG